MGQRPPDLKPPAHWAKSLPAPPPDPVETASGPAAPDPLGEDPTRYGDWTLKESRSISDPAASGPIARAARLRFAVPFPSSHGARIVGIMSAVLLLLLIAAFPYGVLKGTLERRLSARVGRPVTIASLERLDRFGFTPTFAIRGLTVPQPAWVGPGDLARLAEARVTIGLFALMTGRPAIRALSLAGVRLALIRARDGRTNWATPGEAASGATNGTFAFPPDARIVDATLIYRDALRDRQASVRVAVDPGAGFRLRGRGVVRGRR